MNRSYKYYFLLVFIILTLNPIYPQWVKTDLDTGNVTSFAVSGTKIYVGTNAIGAFLSTNNGTTWAAISNGLTNKSINDLAVDGFGFLYAATSSGLFLTTNGGINWFLLSQFVYSPVKAIIVNRDNIFVGTEYDGRDTPGKVLRSSDFGVNWYSVLSQLSKFDGIYSLANKKDTIIAGTFFGNIAISINNGINWNTYLNGVNYNPITSLIFNGKNIYATCSLTGLGAGISCSTNGGSNWFSINNGLPNLYVYKLAFYENNIFAATGAGVFQSTNNGANWFDISNGLNSQQVYSLIIIGDTLFAGTANGVWYRSLSEILDVKTEKFEFPNQFILKQNYPNPFNPNTTINYSIANSGNVKLTIFNALGSNIATILNEYKPAGEYSVQFNASNLPSGIYFYRIQSGSFIDTKKMILLK